MEQDYDLSENHSDLIICKEIVPSHQQGGIVAFIIKIG